MGVDFLFGINSKAIANITIDIQYDNLFDIKDSIDFKKFYPSR